MPLLLLLIALFLAACQPSGLAATPTPASPPVSRLRIQHNGGAVVDRLVLIFPKDRIEFTDIEPGETTDYVAVPNGVYQYAAFETEINGKKYEQPVIDWMGEEPVKGQDFTWLIDVEPNRGEYSVVQLVKATIDR